MRNLLILAVVVLLTACGGGDDHKPKSLFSLWINDGPPMKVVDLTGGDFSTPLLYDSFFPDGAQCTCDLTVIGNQSTGSYVFNFCAYVVGSGTVDPGCNALNNTGTYSLVNDVLTITSNGFPPVVYR